MKMYFLAVEIHLDDNLFYIPESCVVDIILKSNYYYITKQKHLKDLWLEAKKNKIKIITAIKL